MTVEEKKYSQTLWLDIATRGIRFGPDREAVMAELLEHLEDKTADLKRIFPDMTHGEAVELALSRMGDPEEIGRELTKIHRPWLGWLWQASRILLAAALCALAVGLVSFLRHNGPVLWLEDRVQEMRDDRAASVVEQVLFGDEPVQSLRELGGRYADWKGVERLTLYNIEENLRLGEAEVTFSEAALWKMEEGRTLFVQGSIDYDHLRDKSTTFVWYLQAEDSLGNHYGYELRRHDGGASMSGFRYLGQESRRKGYTWSLCLDALPEEAEWVRFTYALRPASDFEFVIRLDEGVSG